MAAAFAHRRKTLEPHPCALPRAEGRYYRQQAGKIQQYVLVSPAPSRSNSNGPSRVSASLLGQRARIYSWRWRESNPRPKTPTHLLLHAYSLYLFLPCHAQRETAMLRPATTNFRSSPRCQDSTLSRFATRTPPLREWRRIQGLPYN